MPKGNQTEDEKETYKWSQIRLKAVGGVFVSYGAFLFCLGFFVLQFTQRFALFKLIKKLQIKYRHGSIHVLYMFS